MWADGLVLVTTSRDDLSSIVSRLFVNLRGLVVVIGALLGRMDPGCIPSFVDFTGEKVPA